MTISINEKPSLLVSLLANEIRERADARNAARTDGVFSGKLDSILNGNSLTQESGQTSAASLAESLNLQMLRATLSLAGDSSDATPVAPSLSDRQSATIQSLIKAYSANLANADASSGQPIQATQPLPQPEHVTTPVANSTITMSQKGNQWLDPIIAKASQRYGVEVGLIKAVIKAESNFNPNAVSHAGARGLMQLMPGTARALGVNDSFDPEQNVMAGTRFLSDLLNRYNGNVDSALAAYNWGPGNVDKRPDRLPRETRDYLVRVKQLYTSYTA